MSICRVITQGVLTNAITVHNYPGLQNGPEGLTGRWFSTDASKQQPKPTTQPRQTCFYFNRLPDSQLDSKSIPLPVLHNDALFKKKKADEG